MKLTLPSSGGPKAGVSCSCAGLPPSGPRAGVVKPGKASISQHDYGNINFMRMKFQARTKSMTVMLIVSSNCHNRCFFLNNDKS